MDDNIPTFISITGATADVARGFLQIANGDFERAVGLYFENPDLVSGVGAGILEPGGVSPSQQTPTTASASRRPNLGQGHSTAVIHISDDDDEDEDDIMHDDNADAASEDDGERAAIQRAAALAQEEEDAAMAKRLQEELYQTVPGSGSGADAGIFNDVRAPIARTTETLIAPDPAWDGAVDEETTQRFLDQLRGRRHPPPRTGGPFGQQIWTDVLTPPSTNETGSHARRLEDLFRPPYDLMSRISWDEARTLGKEDKKWIMVNLQDMNDFNCQALNRDIWKDKAIVDLVTENFIFLQYDKDYPDAEEYITFYFPNRSHENPDRYPHVSIVDPRTGEQVKVWSGRPFPKASEFNAELAEFLDRYSLAANSKNPVAKTTTRTPVTVDVDRMTEDEMLEMALRNSLASGQSSGGTSSTPNIRDPDALTKSPVHNSSANSERKGKEPEKTLEQGAFALISSTNLHTEPENNPATTRIQFRHPTGRVIRRFSLQDPVQRIYEWLKAEPLEGKEGVEFELKKMPQGQDLIKDLNNTIEASGLKQGTVMIEFIED